MFWNNSLENIKSNNRPIIGWFCTYTPEELIYASGAHPFRITGTSTSGNRMDEYLPNYFCSYMKSCLESAFSEKYNFLDGVVFTNSCNAMERVYDIWKNRFKDSFVYIINVPRVGNEKNLIFFKQELINFKNAIENHFNNKVEEHSLLKTIEEFNETRTLLKEMSSIVTTSNTDIGFINMIESIDAASYYDRTLYNNKLSKLIDKYKSMKTENKDKKSRRILVAGGIIQPEMIELIEKCGAKVVCMDSCNESRYYEGQVGTESDLMYELAQRYLYKIPCARMMNSEEIRVQHILKLIEEKDVDGVIYVSLKFCIVHSYDLYEIRKQLNTRNIPFISIESDYSNRGMDLIRTRIEAFIEML